MTAKIVFLAALTLVMVAVAAFAAVMVREARRAGGGAHPSGPLLRQMLRSPQQRPEVNRWAFYAHRFSGVVVFAFLVLHVGDVSLYAFARGVYRSVQPLYGGPVLRVFECGLMFAVVFHILNGLRLIAVDMGDVGEVGARRLLAAACGATLILGAAGSLVILGPVFG